MSTVTENHSDILDRVRIAAPCAAKWDAMPGGERVRSCARCGHKVYNLSEMASAEAAELIRGAEGRVCVRLYRRADGSVMTRDCPRGVRAARQRLARAATLAFASALSVVGLFSLADRMRGGATGAPAPVAGYDAVPVMGEVAVAPARPEVADPASDAAADPTTVRPVPTGGTVWTGFAAGPGSYHELPVVNAWGEATPERPKSKRFLPPTPDPTVIREDPFAPLPASAAGRKAAGTAGRP